LFQRSEKLQMSISESEAKVLAEILMKNEIRLGEDSPVWVIFDMFVQSLPKVYSTAPEQEAMREKRKSLAVNLMGDIDLPLLFSAVNKVHREGHRKRIKDVDQVLECIFSTSLGFEMLSQRSDLKPFLCAALDASQPQSLQRTSIRALRSLAVMDENNKSDVEKSKKCHWLLSQPATGALVNSVGLASTSIAEASGHFIVDLLRGSKDRQDSQRIMLEILFAIDSMKKHENRGTAMLRYAELVSQCCTIGDEILVAAQESGALEFVMNLIRGIDPFEKDKRLDALSWVNALEYVPLIASPPLGSRFIITSGLADFLLQIGDDPHSSVPLSAAALRAVSEVAVLVSGVAAIPSSEKLPVTKKMLELAHKFLSVGNEEAIRLAGISAVTSFAKSSSAALQMVLENNEICRAWLSLDGPGGAMNSLMKAATLHSVARVLGKPVASQSDSAIIEENEGDDGMHEDEDTFSDASDSSMRDAEQNFDECFRSANRSPGSEINSASQLRRRLWLRFGGCNSPLRDNVADPETSPVPLLVEMLGKPIIETQQASFDVLRCAAHQKGGWGLKEIIANRSILSLLTGGSDCDTMVNSREGLEWRFALVESIMRCPEKHILGEVLLDFLDRVLRNGPFGPPLCMSIYGL